jgi:uncharacterized repeat protein (TIGR01451 family)
MSHRSLRVWQVRVDRLIGILAILSLVIPPNAVSASSSLIPAPVVAGPIDQPVQTPASSAEIAETVTSSAPTPALQAGQAETTTPVVEATLTPTATPAPVTGLALTVSAQPEAAKPGDSVTFTVTLQNTSETAFTNLVLADSLPVDYEINQSNLDELKYDSATRILTWTAAELLPGQTETLSYVVTVGSSNMTDGPAYVVDSLVVSAIELAQPLKAETAVLLTPTDLVVSSVNTEGGTVSGLNGTVLFAVPAGAVDGPQAIVVKDLSAELPAQDGQVWTVFHVSLLANANANPLADQVDSQVVGENVGVEEVEPGGAVEVSETPTAGEAVTEVAPTAEVTVTDEPVITETATDLEATITETAPTTEEVTAIPETTATSEATETPTEVAPTATPVTEEEVTAAEIAALVETETDTQLALQPVEAQFNQPVEMTISFDGLTDLATLDAGYEPYLVTLDEASGIWVVMPIESIDRAANTITAEVSHFSTWGAGVGPSFPQNGANVLLFDSASPDLFAGNAHFSLPIWTPRGPAEVHGGAVPCYPSNPVDGAECRNGEARTSPCDYFVPCASGFRWSLQPPSWHYTTVNYTITYDKASYLKQIDYTGNTQAGAPSEVVTPVYSVFFELENRSSAEGDDQPLPAYNWNNWDSQRLHFIRVRYTAPGTSTPVDVRVYELKYNFVAAPTDDGKTWTTTFLKEVLTTGMGAEAADTFAPKVSFTYIELDNRANCGSGCQEWKYPRLLDVNNGWGGKATFTYQNDGRPSTSWYNWRVSNLSVSDGISGNSPLKTDFAYSNACYKTPDTTNWSCTSGDQTELVGYGQTTVTTKDFNGTTTLGIAIQKFHTYQQKQGREYETQYQKPDGTVLSKNTTTYTVVTSGLPTNGYFTYASASESFVLQDTALKRITHNEYGYDTTTGNLLWSKEYDGVPPLTTPPARIQSALPSRPPACPAARRRPHTFTTPAWCSTPLTPTAARPARLTMGWAGWWASPTPVTSRRPTARPAMPASMCSTSTRQFRPGAR